MKKQESVFGLATRICKADRHLFYTIFLKVGTDHCVEYSRKVSNRHRALQCDKCSL